MDIRKKFFPAKVVKDWNKFSKEVVGAPSLKILKVTLGMALSNLI